MRAILSIVICLCLGLNANASSVSAVAPGGNWSDAGTWDGPVPGCYDTIIIPVGCSVVVDATVDLTGCSAVYMFVYGNIHFLSTNKLQLPCGSGFQLDGGPPPGTLTADNYGNNNKKLEICGTKVWASKDGALNGPLTFGAPLPIELLDFNAEIIKRQTHISWITKSETDNDFFTIQRSKDGSVWENIGEVDGAGNSTIELEYSFIDAEPYIGINYYQLKQTDFDGASETFDPVAVINDGIEFDSELLVFPNPSGGDVITLLLSDFDGDELDVEMISISGQIIFNKKIKVSDGGVAALRLPYIPADGMYSIRANAEIDKVICQ